MLIKSNRIQSEVIHFLLVQVSLVICVLFILLQPTNCHNKKVILQNMFLYRGACRLFLEKEYFRIISSDFEISTIFGVKRCFRMFIFLSAFQLYNKSTQTM